MTILAIVLVMLNQAVNGILQYTHTQNQQMDSVASARRAIDVMAADLQNAVVGENAAILAPDSTNTNNLFGLLTSRRGANDATGHMATSHRFLAVIYTTSTNNQIIRSYGSVDFSHTDLLSSVLSGTTTPVEPLAKGILAVQARALADGTNSYALSSGTAANWATKNYNGFSAPLGFNAILTHAPAFASTLTNRTRALEIWIAAVDDQNYQLLQNSGKLTVVQGALGADPQTWHAAIDAAAIPAQAKSGIRVLNKTIPLP